MENKELILSELAYDYGMDEQQVENLIYLLLANDELFRLHLRSELRRNMKGDK